jgi:hypothetical protein
MITQGSKKFGLWLFAALLICCMSLTSCSENDSSGGSSPESEAVENGTISETRLNDSVRRILMLKYLKK